MTLIKRTQITNVGEGMEKREPSTVGWNVYWCSHWQSSMEVSQKSKSRTTTQPDNSSPGCISEKTTKTLNLTRYTHPSVHSSNIYNCQNIEASKCASADEWIKM